MNTNMIVKGVKFVVNACVNRTVVEGIDNLTRGYHESMPKKIVKFIGREGLGLAVTAATKKVIDGAIDEAAEFISDMYIKVTEKD